VASSVETVQPTPSRIPKGVPPLRAGQGHSFFWRRLHSLSGIVPVGAFLVEHFISNAFATNGPQAYADQVKFLTGLPFTIWLEIFGIYIPILYHALYGIYIWWRGETNVTDYPWAGNWMYTAQRWTGIIAFVYMGWHVYTMRFTGLHLFGPNHIYAFAKVRAEFQQMGELIFTAVGIVAASWHFAYGIWLFCAKWGITVGDGARRKLGYVCLLIGLTFTGVGLLTMRAFLQPPAKWPTEQQKLMELPAGEHESQNVPAEAPAVPHS
jgi:succinate dehydrogenase / fumarate reductase cytochrome b subunit